jgi:hypothetical protein
MNITKNHYALCILIMTLHVSYVAASQRELKQSYSESSLRTSSPQCARGSWLEGTFFAKRFIGPITTCLKKVKEFPQKHPLMSTLFSTLAPQALRYACKQPQYFYESALVGGCLSYAGYQCSKPSRHVSPIARHKNQERPESLSKRLKHYAKHPAAHVAVFAAGSCATHPTFIKFCTDSLQKHPYLALLGATGILIGLRYRYYQCDDKPNAEGDSDSEDEQRLRQRPGSHALLVALGRSDGSISALDGSNPLGIINVGKPPKETPDELEARLKNVQKQMEEFENKTKYFALLLKKSKDKLTQKEIAELRKTIDGHERLKELGLVPRDEKFRLQPD